MAVARSCLRAGRVPASIRRLIHRAGGDALPLPLETASPAGVEQR
jgi:hypothetical protein